jgi:two-component system alkaline phosphatase synthesis response regulator PhoP
MAHASEKKILVVDDEPDVRNFLAACLEDAGFVVDTAVDGVDALEKLEANPPDLMTLDMVMPRLSGVKVIRRMRKNEKWADLPVIVITAHAHDELGSDDIKGFYTMTSGLRPRITLDKPVSPEKLVKTIGEVLNVEVDSGGYGETGAETEKDKILKLLEAVDGDTLKEISNILGEKQK